MKFFTSLLLLIIFFDISGQTKSSITNEIKDYKQKVYMSAMYHTSIYNLKVAVSNCFNGYKLYEQDSSSITLTKVNDLNPKRNSQEQKHFIYIEFVKTNDQFLVKLSDRTESYSKPFTTYDLNQNRGTFKLNKSAFYSCLYHQFYEKIVLPENLIKKIDAYNTQQKNDKKKLIAGRDY